MQAFTRLDGRAAPLTIANIDTDQIIPAKFLKTVERAGIGKGLFFNIRRLADGSPDPDFVLNKPEFQGTSVLIAGDNFGCGSSREHAPWALLDEGIRCVISSSFADIFYGNCFNNGLLPVVLKPDEVQQLMDEAKGGNHMVSIDLESQTVTSPSGMTFSFEIDPHRKTKMLKGLDAIGETMQHTSSIDAFETKNAGAMPWLEGLTG
jgi:3-isopropylmalate/(R)-2-methylmalate dehydratase small subunit